MALPQQNRLRSNRDFSRVHSKGKRAATRNLAIRALKQKTTVSLSAKTTAKKVGKAAKGQSANEFSFALLSCEKKEIAGAIGPRFGISISRKVSKRAVVRNRIKRRLKAIIRAHFMEIDPDWQLVIVVRPPAVECSFDEFLRELEYLLQKLAIVSP